MPKHYRKIDAESLHHLPASDMHPADTYFHFSFANYYNPENIRFGVLRVFNDDDIKPHSGFDKHPHQDMEIVSYIIRGKLTHWDNVTEEEEVLERGHVQAVTAGSGIWHSERNRHDSWNRLLQIWILPPARNLPVRYGKHKFHLEERENKLLQIVGNSDGLGQVPLHLYQDTNMFVSEITDPNARVCYRLEEGRQAYINNVEGSVDIEGIATLDERDSLEVTGPADLEFSQNNQACHFIIIEMSS